ncbi:MAG: YitT family protein [Candidatus Cryptobacteroides sp.]|nr:YitT family protein [Bacteroides sp.]MCI7547426.1 YitT family protein [Bacteroides sp.]MDY5406823.1 YitT family protein [Candidatus Cryptobacteroides sp.]
MDYIIVSLGTLMFCLSWDAFLIPNGIAAGGLTGACTVLQFATNGLIPVAYSTFIANAALLVMGVIVLGHAFGIKTVYVVVLSSVLFKILPEFDWVAAVPGNFLFIDNRALIPIVGGLLEAVGVGLIFQRGGSTGGTDIAALVLNKFWPISPGKVYLYSDIFIIASVLLIPGKTFEDMIYGYLSMITFSFMLDFVLLGSKSTVQVLVFTQKYEEMADYMMAKLHRGVTALKAVGWYTKQDKNVLLIVARKSQMPELSKAIKHIDDKAFVSVSPASSVYGEGFDQLKTGIEKKKKAEKDLAISPDIARSADIEKQG